MNEKWKKAMEYARATQEMEGLSVTSEQEKLVIDNLEGKITDEEFFKLVLEMVNGSLDKGIEGGTENGSR